MQKLFSIIFLFLTFNNSSAQAVWDESIIKKAKSANKENYLNASEKDIIYYINLVRSNPVLFEKTYLKKYLDSTKTNNNYTKSLIKTLKNSLPVNILDPSKTLYDVAKSHAIEFGKSGKIGHGDFISRIKTIKGEYGDTVAENCDYGNNDALNIVMSLLIDEGDPKYGHRTNILNPDYKFIGVSIQKHKKYEWNCVMDFGGIKK